jgi:hypothetical protein
LSEELPGGSTPSQYGLPADAGELQDLIEYRNMNFAIGNIFKACYRMGTCEHSDSIRDLRKILWFAQRELDRQETEAGARKAREMRKSLKKSIEEAENNPRYLPTEEQTKALDELVSITELSIQEEFLQDKVPSEPLRGVE